MTLFFHSMPPTSDGVPHQRARNGDQQRLEQAQMAFAQQIPSQNPDKNADTLGERKLR
jgi:hypothetical protein